MELMFSVCIARLADRAGAATVAGKSAEAILDERPIRSRAEFDVQDQVAMEFYFHELDRSLLILSADGGLNADTATDFVQQLESLIKAGAKQIIIDCTNLNYISSYGVGML